MHALTQDHLEDAYRVLKYLKGYIYRRHGHSQVEVYADVDWARSLTSHRFTLGYCSFMRRNLVTWRSKKQFVVLRSSAKAELRSMAHGVYESLWLKMLMDEAEFPVQGPMSLYCEKKL